MPQQMGGRERRHPRAESPLLAASPPQTSPHGPPSDTSDPRQAAKRPSVLRPHRHSQTRRRRPRLRRRLPALPPPSKARSGASRVFVPHKPTACHSLPRSPLQGRTGEDPKEPTAPGARTTRSRQRHPPTPEHLKARASAQPIGDDPWRVRSSFLPQFRVRLVSKWTTCSHHCASAFVCLLQRSLPSWLRDCGSFLKFAANIQMWCRC